MRRGDNGDALAVAILIVGGLISLALIIDFIATYFVIIVALVSLIVLLVGLGLLLWVMLRN